MWDFFKQCDASSLSRRFWCALTAFYCHFLTRTVSAKPGDRPVFLLLFRRKPALSFWGEDASLWSRLGITASRCGTRQDGSIWELLPQCCCYASCRHKCGDGFFFSFKLILSASFIDSMTKSSVSVCVAIRGFNHSAVQSIFKKIIMVLVNNYFCFNTSQRSEWFVLYLNAPEP